MKFIFKTIAYITTLSAANFAFAEQCSPIKIDGDNQAQQLWQKSEAFFKQSYQKNYNFSKYCLTSPNIVKAETLKDGTKFTFTEGSGMFLSVLIDEKETMDISIIDKNPSSIIINDLGDDLLQIKTNYESDALQLIASLEDETIEMDMSVKLDYDINMHTKYFIPLKTSFSMPLFNMTSNLNLTQEAINVSFKDIIVNSAEELQDDTIKGGSNMQFGAAHIFFKPNEKESLSFSWQDGEADIIYDNFSISSMMDFRSCVNDISSLPPIEDDMAAFTALQACYFDYLKQHADSNFDSDMTINNIKFTFSDMHEQFDFSSKKMLSHMSFKPDETHQTIKFSYTLDDMDYNTVNIPIPDNFRFNQAAATLGLAINKEKLGAAETLQELDLNNHQLIAGLKLSHPEGAAIDFTSNTALSVDKKLTFDNIDAEIYNNSPLDYLTTDSTVILTDQNTIFAMISAFIPEFRMYGSVINLLSQKEYGDKRKYHVTIKDGTLKVNDKTMPKLF